jgi:hypothetical protein
VCEIRALYAIEFVFDSTAGEKKNAHESWLVLCTKKVVHHFGRRQRKNASHKFADVATFMRCQLEMNYYFVCTKLYVHIVLNVFMNMFLKLSYESIIFFIRKIPCFIKCFLLLSCMFYWWRNSNEISGRITLWIYRHNFWSTSTLTMFEKTIR